LTKKVVGVFACFQRRSFAVVMVITLNGTDLAMSIPLRKVWDRLMSCNRLRASKVSMSRPSHVANSIVRSS
jgi:hypothetical protein